MIVWLIAEEGRVCGSALICIMVNPDEMIVSKFDAYFHFSGMLQMMDNMFIPALVNLYATTPGTFPDAITAREPK